MTQSSGVIKDTKSTDAYSDQVLGNLQTLLGMTVLHALAAAVLVCGVTALRLPDLDAKLDINTDLSEASLAVQVFSLNGVGFVWAASLPASPWLLQDFVGRLGGCRLPDSDFLEG